MDPIIKNRIEQINRGEVPQGYKKTSVGIVPVEWKLTKLRELLEFKNGINAEKEKFGAGIKLISVMDILDAKPIYYSTIKGSINIDSDTLESYSVTYGDILFQRSSENFEDAGKSNVYLDKNNTATYSGFVIRGKKIFEYVPTYLNKLLKTAPIRKQIKRYAAGSQHINVGQNSLSKVELCVAGDREQARIADILSKWDEAVTLQEKLIQKLELQKKALMQKLLASKEGWKKVKVGTLTQELSIRNKNNDCSNIKSVSNKFGFVNQDEQFSKQIASQDTSNYKKVNYGNIAYNPSRINVGSIAIYEENDTGIVSPMYVVFSCKKIAPKLLLLLLSTCRGQYDIKTYLSGSVRDSLNYSDLKNIVINIPDGDTQKVLVCFFESVDNRLCVHKDKLQKLKDQQKAIQQLILTGTVRVN